MSQSPGEITLTPNHYSDHMLHSDSTQEEEDADKASSEFICPTSVKSCYLFGSFHSPSNEEPNVPPGSGAENKTADYQSCRKLLQDSNRGSLDDSVTKFHLDSSASIGSDELFGSFHTPSNEQINLKPVLGAECLTTGIDDQDKVLMPETEDNVCILDESCQDVNVPQVKPLSEKLRAQGFDGRSRDSTNSHPDNTFEAAYFPGTIPMSGSFISQSSKLVGQSIDCTNVKSGCASPVMVKMECSRENMNLNLTEYSDPNADHHSIHRKAEHTRKGLILLKSSRAHQCTEEKTSNHSMANQNQSGLGAFSSIGKVGSDVDEEGQTDACQGQMYPSPVNPDLDDTMKSSETPLSPVNAPLHSGTFIQEILFSSPNMKAEAIKIGVHQSSTGVSSHTMSISEEQLITGEYSLNNVLHQATPGVPSQNMSVPIPDMKMSQTHAEVCLQRLTIPQPNMDTEVPCIAVPQPISRHPRQHVSVSLQPTFPPPQLSLMDSITPWWPLVDSQPPQEVHKGPRDIAGHRSTALETVLLEEDETYVEMTEGQIQYNNDSVNNNVHPEKNNFEELQQISHDSQLCVKEGFKSYKEASSDSQVNPTESEMNTSSHSIVERLPSEDVNPTESEMNPSSHSTVERLPSVDVNPIESEMNTSSHSAVERLPSEDVNPNESEMNTSSHSTVERLPSEYDAERFSSVDSDGYARFKEMDDVDYLTPVFRDDFKPLKVRPKGSAEFPLPPVPGVQRRPFSEADVDHQRKTELPPFKTVTGEIKSKQEKDQEVDERQRMIRVRGLKSSLSLDALELFFENKKKSGGGEIENLEWKKNKGVAVITFKYPSVVQSVLEKQKRESFYLEETRLIVEECVPLPPDPIRLFLKNLSPSTTQELLVLYLEPCCKAIPIEILFKRLPGTALVTFSEPPDVEKLLVRVKEKPFEGQYIQVVRIPITRHVRLSGLLPSTTRDIIELYFNNTKHSGGGPVTDVRFGRDKQSCVVSFENVKDAERVCIRPHTIDKKDIQVCLYYECLDDDLDADTFSDLTDETEDTVDELKLPDPVEVKDLNFQILRFLVKNEKHKHMFEKSLSDINGIARWPSSADMYLIIECTVKAEDKNAREVLKDWSIRVADKVNSFAAGIEVAGFNTMQKAWYNVIKGLQASNIDNPEDVSVFLEQEKYNITVAGPKAAVEKLKKTVLDIIAKVDTQIELEKQSVTETKQMKTYEMTLLKESQFKEDIEDKYYGLSFDLNMKDMRAIFVGQSDVVQKAVVQMHEKLQSFVSISMPISKAAKDLLFVKEITDYIKQKMKSQKVIGVWDVVHREEVRMFARDEGEVQKAIQIVRDCLVEKEIKLDNMVQNVQEKQWSQLVQGILEKHKQKVVIETKLMKVLIVAVDDIFQSVFDEIKIYLEEYNSQGLFLVLESEKVKFIQRYKMEDIKSLEKRFENSHVKLLIVDCGDQKGIKINGTEDGCKAVKTELTKLTKIVMTKEHVMVDKVGLKKLLQSSRGREQLSSVELKFKCCLVMKDSGTSSSLQPEGASGGNSSGSEDDTGKSDESKDRHGASIDVESGESKDRGGVSIDVERIKVSVVQGELAKQRAFSTVPGENTQLSSSTHGSALSTSDISTVRQTCRYTLSHSVVLEIVQGDITKETTDVIVNSVLSNLNLTQGQVSKAILTAGGISIQQECQNKIPDLKKDGFVVTEAGKLPCKMIIHILVLDKRKEWEDVIKRVLLHADKLKFQSISFPGVGTGGRGLSVKMIAKAMHSACREFAKSEPNCLKKIRLVLFQEAVFNAIKDHVTDQVESKKSKLPAFGKLFKGKSKQSSIVFSITIDSESNFQAAVKDLEGFIKNEFM